MNIGMETRLKLARPAKNVSPKMSSEPKPSVRSSAATETAPSAKAIGMPIASKASRPPSTRRPAVVGSTSVSHRDFRAGCQRRIVARLVQPPQLDQVLQAQNADAERQR